MSDPKINARAFAKRRDEMFDKTRERARKIFQEEFNPDAILENPTLYLKLLFTQIGSQVVQSMMEEAKKAGKEYGKRF